MDIHDELLKRYKYLYDNKELILANCIVYGIEEKYIKQKIKELKINLKRINKNPENQTLIDLVNHTISAYKEDLNKPKPYLSSKISDDYIDMLEELILGDVDLEETRLYRFIENIKENNELLAEYNSMINDLEERRNNNRHLKNVLTFTVWKILSYVRKKYSSNATVSLALDKYYNLDRFTIANDDCSYGYYIPSDDGISYNYPNSTLYACAYDSCVAFNYRGNEFEEEDNYYASKLDDKITSVFYPSQFANNLASSEMIHNKKEKMLENIKTKTITTISL